MPRTQKNTQTLAVLVVAACLTLVTSSGWALTPGQGAAGAPSVSSARSVTPEGRVRHQRGWWQLWRPSKKTAEESLAYANSQREAARTRKALREYRALVYQWPDAPEAPAAQLQFANLLFQRNRLEDAFNEYQFLIENYPGFFNYDQVIERQVEIAMKIAETRKRFLLFSWSYQEDAIPMLEKIIFNAPSWDRTGRLQFRIAEIYENTGEPEMAIESFSTLLTRYPGSPHAEEAAFRRALCHSKLAHSYPNSAETRASAAMAAAEFLQRFPRSKHAQKVRDILERLDDAQAKELFKIARIYDRTHSRPVAAVFMYEQFLSQYPDSPLAENARKRIAALKPTIQGGNP